MVETHKEAISKTISLYHEFLSRYNKRRKAIYAFTEGKEDLSFYRGIIDAILEEGWKVEIWHAGNKSKVFELYDKVDWETFNRHQILFFVDRDLSEYLENAQRIEDNIYITDLYSIENYYVEEQTFERVITECYGFNIIGKDDLDRIVQHYCVQLERFRNYAVEIMSWIIVWRRRGRKPCLNDIKLNELFSMNDTILVLNGTESDFVKNKIHQSIGIDIDEVNIDEVKEEFLGKDGKSKFIRGKYLAWFLVFYCEWVYSNVNLIVPTIAQSPKKHIQLGQSNASYIIAPRIQAPISLIRFLHYNIEMNDLSIAI